MSRGTPENAYELRNPGLRPHDFHGEWNYTVLPE